MGCNDSASADHGMGQKFIEIGSENSPEVICFLLQQGVDVDYLNEMGLTPLSMAVLNKCHFAIRILLQNGANAEPVNKWQHMRLIELAIKMKDPISIELLVQYGADINAKNSGVYTGSPLLFAVFCAVTTAYNAINGQDVTTEINDWVDIVDILIALGAKIESDSITQAVRIATEKNYLQIIELLIERGADINSVDTKYHYGLTPLATAILRDRLDLVDLFIKSGADVNKKISPIRYNGELITPLSYAIRLGGNPEIIRCLLVQGAKV